MSQSTPTAGDTPTPAKAPRGSRSAPRKTARLAAVQALYEIEVSSANVHEVVPDMIGRGFANLMEDPKTQVAPPDSRLFETLVLGVSEDRAVVDELISSALDGALRLERLEVILRAILRLGTYELLALSDVPAKVVISEYMDIADAFFAEREPALINGVLDRIAHKIREDDLPSAGKGNPPSDEQGT